MSTTRSDGLDTRKTYVMFRVVGDTLDPETMTKVLRVAPTVQYAKDQTYFAGKRTGSLVGKTGLWCLSTDKLLLSDNMHEHVSYLLGVLIPGREDAHPFLRLHALLTKHKDWRADLCCFWHGRAGAKQPSIPKAVTEVMKFLPATIETDFATDTPSESERQTA